MISVSEYPPCPPLADLITCYSFGVYNTEGAEHTTIEIIPSGCPELIIHLQETYCRLPGNHGLTATPDYMLIGLFNRTFSVSFFEPVPVFSIRFRPEALYKLFQLQGAEVADTYEDGRLVFGHDFNDLCHRIREEPDVRGMIDRTEKFLLRRLTRQPRQEDYVAHSAALMRDGPACSVREISERVCISQRQLERKFRRVIGTSPKQYLNIMRINRVIHTLARHPNMNLTSVAYYCGYFDQAHFIKDFKRVTGQLPGDYRKGGRNLISLPS